MKFNWQIIGLLMCSLTIRAQVVQRQLPREWENLVLGGSFVDRFEPMPEVGKLTSDTWGGDNVKPRYVDNGIEDSEWSYWGGSIHRGDDGKYHHFGCRWPEDSPKGHFQWKESEVFHAVSENPYGPFEVRETLFKGHNPKLHRLKNGHYMLNNGTKVSESIYGPWKSNNVVRNNRDRDVYGRTQNIMSMTQREDGSFIAVTRLGDIWISKTGISEYNRITMDNVYPEIEADFEDPVIWRTNVQYHMIVNDWSGKIAYYMRSKDGISWKHEPGIAYATRIAKHKDGTVEDWAKFEVVSMLQDEYGRAVQTNFAAIDVLKHQDKGSDNHNSKNICIPLTRGKLIEVLNEVAITKSTKKIKVKIKAESGFNPYTDIDLNSLRFGASDEVNYGRGSKVVKTKKAGNDVVLVFDGKGHGLTNENFAGKMLGKTKDGKLLFGYSRLKGVNYYEPLLSACAPKYSRMGKKTRVEIEVQNFGLAASDTARIKLVAKSDKGDVIVTTGKVAALEPYEKQIIEMYSNQLVKRNSDYRVKVAIEDRFKPSMIDFNFNTPNY